LWFYVSGLVILVGAEMNAEIEHASSQGKDPGEKVAGQSQQIPRRAMRRWMRLRRAHGEKPPSAEDVKAVLSSRVPHETSEEAPGASPHQGESQERDNV
jgi:hypothetical protein